VPASASDPAGTQLARLLESAFPSAHSGCLPMAPIVAVKAIPWAQRRPRVAARLDPFSEAALGNSRVETTVPYGFF